MWQFNFLLNNLHEKFDETFLNCAHAQHRMDFLRNLTLLYHLNHGVLAFCQTQIHSKEFRPSLLFMFCFVDH